MVYFIPMRRRGIEETAVDTHPKSMHITSITSNPTWMR